MIHLAGEDPVHGVSAVHDHRADLLTVDRSVVVVLLWQTSREVCSIGTSASDSSETKLCRSSRLWDNEVLMDWYAANDGSIRPKGTMYFVLHPHGLNMSWVSPRSVDTSP
jgi:hypothetical protein